MPTNTPSTRLMPYRFFPGSFLLPFYIGVVLLLGPVCTQTGELVPVEILDYIHFPQPHPVFMKADQLKYEIDYNPCLEEYNHIWQSGRLVNIEDSIYCLNQLAYLYLCMYKDSAAAVWIEKAEKVLNGRLEATSLGAQGDYWYNKGVFMTRSSNRTNARTPLINAHRVYSKFYGENKLRTAQSSNSLGLWCTEYALDSSYEYILTAFDFFSSREKNKLIQNQAAENYLGMNILAYFDRETEKAITFGQKGLEILRSNRYQNKILEGRLHVNLMRSYVWYSELSTDSLKSVRINAIKSHYNSADSLLKSSGTYYFEENLSHFSFAYFLGLIDPGHWNEHLDKIKKYSAENVCQYLNIDLLFCNYYYGAAKRNFADRLFFYKKLLDHGDAVLENDKSLRALTTHQLENFHYILSDALNESGSYQKALEIIKKDIVYGTIDEKRIKEIRWEELCRKEIRSRKKFQFLNYGRAASAFLKLHHAYPDNNSFLLSACRLFIVMDTMIQESVESSNQDALIRILHMEGDELFSNAVASTFLLHEKFPNEKKYVDIALNFIEKRKSFALFSEIRDKVLFQPYQLRQMKTKLKEIEADIINQKNLGYSTEDLVLEKSKLMSNIQRQFPEYKIYPIRTIPPIDSIAGKLAPDEIIIDYYLARDVTYAISVTNNPKEVEFKKIAETPKLNFLIQKFENCIDVKSNTSSFYNNLFYDFTQYAYELNQMLVAPFEGKSKMKKSMIIIPEKQIRTIPFDALLSEKSDHFQEYDYKNLPYLMHKYAVSYLTSIENIGNFAQKKNTPAHEIISFYGDSPDINAIKEFPENYCRSDNTTLIKKCRKKDFLSKIANQNIIQVTAHGRSSTQIKNQCKIYFNAEDNVKETMLGHEILGLELKNNPLVILIVCESDLGDNKIAEGPFSVSRYFIQAGAGMVVSSSSQIDYQTSQNIIKYFYTYTSEGNTPNIALNKAKLSYLKESKEKFSPYFWALLKCFV